MQNRVIRMFFADVDADAWEYSHYCAAFHHDADVGHILERLCRLSLLACLLAVAPLAKTLSVYGNKLGESGEEKLRVAARALPDLDIQFEDPCEF